MLVFTEIGETASKLRSRIEEAKIKRKGDKEGARFEITVSPNKKQHIAHDLGKSLSIIKSLVIPLEIGE